MTSDGLRTVETSARIGGDMERAATSEEFFSSAKFDGFVAQLLANLEAQLDRRLNRIESRIDSLCDLSKVGKTFIGCRLLF